MLMDQWRQLVKKPEAEALAEFFLACRNEPRPPALGELVLVAFAEIDPDLTLDLTPLMTACAAAEAPTQNAYHSHHHNREVALTTALLTLHHMRDGNDAGFTPRAARNLVMAAAVHDLGHNGIGNTVDGVHKPLYLERQSLKLAAKLWQGQDVTKEDMRFITGCITPTDVSKKAGGKSPRDHFRDAFNNVAGAPCIYKNKMWREAAAMLSDADLAISGALSPEMFAENARVLSDETGGKVPASPGSAKFFFEQVAPGFPLSSAANDVLGESYKRVKLANGLG